MVRNPDSTDGRWAAVEPLLPAAKPGGRQRSADLREVLDALLYQNRSRFSRPVLPLPFTARLA